jgi:diguanylate cyclase (GGDEF)-like protein
LNPSAKVLIVDDDVTSISIVAQLLEPEFEVAFATSGAQALALIPRLMPDLILLDVVMPDMDGYALCTQLKRDLTTAGIPIIFITGLLESESESYGLELGAADYVTKPFNAGVVRARVRNNIELKRSRDRLFSLAATDGMTGLFNRRVFDVALERESKRLARTRGSLALVMLDVDFFKPFNDRYGHVAGDECLRLIAAELREAVHRPADVAARYGGEEFICILPETGIEGGVKVAERIQRAIAALAIPHAASAVAPIVTASFGVASAVCAQQLSGEDLLRSVDARLYEAKANGRNRIVASTLATQAPVRAQG